MGSKMIHVEKKGENLLSISLMHQDGLVAMYDEVISGDTESGGRFVILHSLSPGDCRKIANALLEAADDSEGDWRE